MEDLPETEENVYELEEIKLEPVVEVLKPKKEIEDVAEQENNDNCYEVEEIKLEPGVGEEYFIKTKDENSVELDKGKGHFSSHKKFFVIKL